MISHGTSMTPKTLHQFKPRLPRSMRRPVSWKHLLLRMLSSLASFICQTSIPNICVFQFTQIKWNCIEQEIRMPRFSIPTTDPAIPKSLCAHNSWHTSVETYSWHGYAKWSPSPDGKKSNHACWKADSLSPLAQSCKILVSCQTSTTNWDSSLVSLSLKKPPSKQIFEVLMYIHVLLDKISTDAKLRPKQQETSYPSREEGVVLLEIKKTQLATISLLQYHSTHLRLIPSNAVADVAETWMKRNDDWLIRTMILFYSTTYLRIKLWQTLPEVLEPPWIHCPRLNPSLHSSSQRLSSRLHASTNNLCVQGAQRVLAWQISAWHESLNHWIQ